MNLVQWKTYEFVFSDGATRRLKYEGFGNSMQLIWRDPLTDEVVHPLPPYTSRKQVD